MKKLTKEEIRIAIYKQDTTQILVAVYGTLKQAINKAVNCKKYVVEDNYCDMWNFGRIEYLEVIKL